MKKDSTPTTSFVGEDGRFLPMSSADAQKSALDIIDRGTLHAVVVEVDGQIVVQIFEPAQPGIPAVLETAARNLRRALQARA
jgi:hypothetical protein